MIGFLKSLHAVFQSVLADVPEGLRVVLEAVWKARWFIAWGLVLWSVYNVVMVALPFLLWGMVIKLVLGSFLSFLS